MLRVKAVLDECLVARLTSNRNEEPFLIISFQNIPGTDREFPLWLSRNARGKIASLNMKGHIEVFSPTTVVWVDQNNNYHCLAWVVIKDSRVHPRPNGIRPYIELEPTDHPLAVEYRNGVTIERVQEIAEQLCVNNDNQEKEH
ncbi:hypothetical protein ABH916_000286 [Peribacillus frigoritolerans]